MSPTVTVVKSRKGLSSFLEGFNLLFKVLTISSLPTLILYPNSKNRVTTKLHNDIHRKEIHS